MGHLSLSQLHLKCNIMKVHKYTGTHGSSLSQILIEVKQYIDFTCIRNWYKGTHGSSLSHYKTRLKNNISNMIDTSTQVHSVGLSSSTVTVSDARAS